MALRQAKRQNPFTLFHQWVTKFATYQAEIMCLCHSVSFLHAIQTVPVLYSAPSAKIVYRMWNVRLDKSLLSATWPVGDICHVLSGLCACLL